MVFAKQGVAISSRLVEFQFDDLVRSILPEYIPFFLVNALLHQPVFVLVLLYPKLLGVDRSASKTYIECESY